MPIPRHGSRTPINTVSNLVDVSLFLVHFGILLVNRRSELATLLEFLREGDTLVVTRLDRLARSLADLMVLAKAKAEGRYKGRPRALNHEQIKRLHSDGVSVIAIAIAIAKQMGCSRSAVYKVLG